MAAEGSGRNRPMASVAIPGEAMQQKLELIRGGQGTSDRISRFIKTLWQRYAACSPHPDFLEQVGRDSMPGEQANEEDEPDAAQVYSLKEHMFRILQELRNNADITRMAESVISENPLHGLAEVSEEMFATGVNWGRIVVFFYFTYEVCRQCASSFFRNVIDWAMNFLRDRLALWIEQQGGWNGMLNFFPSSE